MQSHLLTGVSVLAVTVAAASAARAGQPPAFSSGWFSQKGAASSSSTGGGTGGTDAFGHILTPQQAEKQAAQAMQALSRSAQELATANAAQRAAEIAALKSPSSVPNGLVAGGLVPDNGLGKPPDWTGATLAGQTTSKNGKVQVTVDQTKSTAVLTWQSFNIGQNTTLYIDQAGGNTAKGGNGWVAFNEIVGNSVAPSEIMGSIKAQGNVYIINQNGILFGPHSQINLQSLVASTLGINPLVVSGNIIKPAYGTGSTGPEAAFSTAYNADPGKPSGDILVETGAQITTGTGGRAFLFGANVENQGRISSPNGQIVLGASSGSLYVLPDTSTTDTSLRGLLVYADLAANKSGAYIGASAINAPTGILTSTTGNVTMVGQSVTQDGIARATTSVNYNGSIDLLSQFNETFGLNVQNQPEVAAPAAGVPTTGTLTLGSTSVTEVTNVTSSETAPESQSFVPSSITFIGKLVSMLGQAVVYTPGGQLRVQATSSIGNNLGSGTPGLSGASGDGSRIYIDNGVVLDTAGVQNVADTVESQIIAVELRAYELRDSPLQRQGGIFGALYGSTIYIDSRLVGEYGNGTSWVGTPLADASAYVLQGLRNNIDQLTVAGGAVSLISSGDVVFRHGALIDASGGWYNFTGGVIDPTRLVGLDGHLYSVGAASAAVGYAGSCCSFQAVHSQWGVTQNFSSALLDGAYYSPGYTQGEAAGNVYITAPAMALDGQLIGTTVDAGPYARGANNRTPDSTGYATTASDPFGVAYWYAAPASTSASTPNTAYSGNTIAIGEPTQGVQNQTTGLTDLGSNESIVISAEAGSLPANFGATTALPASLDQIEVPASWINSGGFKNLFVSTNANVTLGTGVTLDLGAGGALDVRTGEEIALNGTVIAPGGAVTLTASGDSNVLANPSMPQLTNDSIVLGTGAVIDLSGLWINDRLNPVNPTGVVQPNGGTLTVSAGKGVDFAAGSDVDVSGGAWLSASDKLTVGNGGTISIAANTEFNATQPGLQTLFPVVLDGTLSAYGVSQAATDVPGYAVGRGGTLNFEVPQLTIDGAGPASWGTVLGALTIGGDVTKIEGTSVVLPASFFSEGGFAQFDITATTGITIAADTIIAPRQSDLVLTDTFAGLSAKASAQSIEGLATIEQLPAITRDPVNLTLQTNFATLAPSLGQGPNGGELPGADIIMQKGAVINADPGAVITLYANHQLTIYGSIIAPDGSIALNGAQLVASQSLSNNKNDFDPGESVWIASGAELSTAGVTLSYIDPKTGLLAGNVLGGGSVSITAPGGYINVQPGATIDASGTASTIETWQSVSGQLSLATEIPTPIASNGGSISFSSTAGVFLDGAITARAGGAAAEGGSLSVTLTDVYDGNSSGVDFAYPQSNRKIIVEQSGLSPIALLNLKPGDALDDTATYGIDNQLSGPQEIEAFGALYGKAYVSADQVTSGGFASLALGVLQPSPHTTAGTYATPAVLTNGGSGATSANYNDSIVFDGSVSLHMANSLILNAENITDSGSLNGRPSNVSLSAPYVEISGQSASNIWGPSVPVSQGGNIGGLTAGTAHLTVSGDLIDIAGVTSIDQFGSVKLASAGDIRLIGGDDLAGQGLLTTGALTLDAAQVYTTTSSDIGPSTNNAQASGGFFLISQTQISLERNGAVPQSPIAAGGNLTIDAPVVVQDGVLRVPQGSLTIGCFTDCAAYLPVSTDIVLGAASVTSVSLDGITVPYGTVANGLVWTAPDGNTLAAPPTKILTLSGASIDIQKGAVVDEAGGGDLYGYEFTPGVGGSSDVLAQTNAQGVATTFAILPGYKSGYAPVDPSQSPKDGLSVGETIYLSGGDGLAPGYYTLLPAHYALLPGAYAVSFVSGSTGFQPDQNYLQTDGGAILSGYVGTANTPFRSAQSQAFEVTPGTVIRTESQFTDYTASSFFPGFAQRLKEPVPELPIDAGSLDLLPAKSLTIEGTFDFTPGTGGLGGAVSLQAATATGAAGDLAILGPDETAPAGYIGVSSAQLSSLDATTLIIGGTLQAANTAVNPNDYAVYQATAARVLIDNQGATLSAPDIVLLGQDSVTVDRNSLIVATPSETNAVGSLAGLSGATTPPAFLQISSGAASEIVADESGTANAGGRISIGAGATIRSSDSIQLAAASMSIDPGAVLAASDITVTASAINLGAAPADQTGLDLSGATLTSLSQAGNLTLHSLGAIDFYGDVTLGSGDTLNSLTLDSAALVGNGSDVTIKAQSVTLTDSDSTLKSVPTAGRGTLDIVAQTITLGGPQSIAAGTTIAGFADADLSAAQQILLRGTGQLAVDGNLTLSAARITGAEQSANPDPVASNPVVTTLVDQSITATGSVTLERVATTTPLSAAPSLGAGETLAISGSSIVDNGAILLPGGTLTMNATNGSISFGAQSETSVAGFAKPFLDVTQYASAGSINLTAAADISVDHGALIDVSAAPGGGDAGRLSVTAESGQFLLDGTLKGSGGVGGSIAIDVKTLPDLSSLAQLVNTDGFTDDLSFRAQTGNLDLTGTVVAHHFSLEADGGSITISGTIDANSATDGEITLAASGDLTLASGAKLLAESSETIGTAGSVVLETTSGRIDAGAGSVIDVAGGGYVDGVSADGQPNIVSGGTVLLRAEQTGDAGASVVKTDDNGNAITIGNGGDVGTGVAIDPIQASIEGARSITAEAVLSYTIDNGSKDALIGSSLEAALGKDAVLFMSNEAAIVKALGETNNPLFTLSPGIEVDSKGNLFLVSDWDLHSWRYGPNGSWPGVLTLRAGGNLTIQGNLSDGFTATPDQNPEAGLVSTPSWSYQLVAGADLAAADPMATAPGSTGTFELGIDPYRAGNNKPDEIGGAKEAMYVVRTGTGAIDVAAAGDIKIDGDINFPTGGYANSDTVLTLGGSSAIYTVGLDTGSLPGFTDPKAGDYPVNALQQLNGEIYYYPAYYTAGGGAVSLRAGGDIVGANDTLGNPSGFSSGSAQYLYAWFYAEGNAAAGIDTSWWSNFSQFQQSIGALGGGNVSVTAGGNINDISIALPSNGRVYNDQATHQSNALLVQGAGDLSVRASGNLQDDLFFIGDGKAQISVGQSILAPIDTTATQTGNDASFGTSLALGNAQVTINAGGNVVLSQIFNPTAAFSASAANGQNGLPNPPDPNNPQNYGTDAEFVTYTDKSALAANTLGGSLTYLGNDPSALDGGDFPSIIANIGGVPTAAFGFLPGNVSLTAFNGNIAIDAPVTLYPTARGTLDLLAENTISLGANQPTAIVQLGITATAVPGVTNPAAPANGGTDPLLTIASSTDYGQILHSGDTIPNHIYALTGDITNTDASSAAGDLDFAKASEVEAGRDIVDIGVVGQNIAAGDVTSIIAGRDILYDVITASSGNYSTPILGDYTSLGAPDIYGFQLGGPGELYVQAGRNIELAGGNGIITYGNSVDPYLASQGAGIVAIAGAVPNYSGFIQHYLTPATLGTNAPVTLGDLTSFLATLLGHPVSAADAWSEFDALPAADQAEFARQVYFQILRETADPTNASYKHYQDGYAAASLLFPTPVSGSSLDLFYSVIETQNGGGIQIFTPGGGVQVGLTNQPSVSGTTEPNAPAQVLKTPAQLGIFTVAGGEIDAFAQTNIEVNLSRIFTDDGGDLVLWSTDGNIDAGKGAKTAIAASPPIEEIDAAGNIVSVPAGSASGSGIAVLAPTDSNLFNSAYLIAPNGTVDAGDAGLRATGNINVVAQHVVNASNIQAGGTVSGVPQVPQISLASLTAASSATSAASNSTDAGDDEERKKRQAARRVPSIITIDVLGFGEPDAAQQKQMSP